MPVVSRVPKQQQQQRSAEGTTPVTSPAPSSRHLHHLHQGGGQQFPNLAAHSLLAASLNSSEQQQKSPSGMGSRQDSGYGAAAISFDCLRLDPATSGGAPSPLFPRLRNNVSINKPSSPSTHEGDAETGAEEDDSGDGEAGGAADAIRKKSKKSKTCPTSSSSSTSTVTPANSSVVVVPLDVSKMESGNGSSTALDTPCCGCAPLLTPSVVGKNSASEPQEKGDNKNSSSAIAEAAAARVIKSQSLITSDSTSSSDSACSATSFGVDFSSETSQPQFPEQQQSIDESNDGSRVFEAFQQQQQQFVVSDVSDGTTTPVTSTTGSTMAMPAFPPPPPSYEASTQLQLQQQQHLLQSQVHHQQQQQQHQPTKPPCVSYQQVNASVQAQIVDQFTLENIHCAPASPLTYRSEHQRGGVVLATARTMSGRCFTVQRVLCGQLCRGYLAETGCHALGKLLSWCSGQQILLFGWPMECPKRAERQSPAMVGIWLPIRGVDVQLVDLQRMRVLFAENGIMCATDSVQQSQLLEEAERRRHQHPQQQTQEQQLLQQQMMMAMSGGISMQQQQQLGMPESPLTLEPARSPPGGSEQILSTLQMPVVLYTPPPPPSHPIFGTMPSRGGFHPFVDTTHRRESNNNNRRNNQNQNSMMTPGFFVAPQQVVVLPRMMGQMQVSMPMMQQQQQQQQQQPQW